MNKKRKLNKYSRKHPRSVVYIYTCVLLLIALVISAGTPLKYVETRAAIHRYGAFPIHNKFLNRLKSDLIKDAQLLKANKLRCRNAKQANKLQFCDADHDGLINSRELMLGTDRLKKDTDKDKINDRKELLKTHTNPLVSDFIDDNMPCPGANFDAAGNTASFGIPAPITGNLDRGQTAYNKSCNVCHAAAEKGTNYLFDDLKLRLSQAPMFFTHFSNPALADLVAYLNRSQTGCPVAAIPTPSSGNGPSNPTPTATPYAANCSNSYFDANGNSTQFSIPSPLVGNITQGASLYAQSLNCNGCHTGEATHGLGMSFTQLKAAVTGPKMGITTVSDQQYSHMAAYLNRSLAPVCGTLTPTPTPTRTPSGPTATPTKTPTPYVGGCSNSYFDASGNTTQFAIPTPLIGNIGQGATYFGLSCNGCHTGEAGHGQNLNFTQLKAAVTGPKMGINTVTDQNYANMVAYLNRSLAPVCSGTPTPTPTPLSNAAAGSIIFAATCQSCHNPPRSLRGHNAGDIREALTGVSRMRTITLTNTQITQLAAYLATL